MSVIELRTLGTLDLRASDGRELYSLLAQPKRIALLAYLCIAEPQGYHRRDTLLGLFWPDSDQEHARTSLRKALHVLRRALGDDAILSRGDEEVAVDVDRIWCDAAAFEESLRKSNPEDALAVYRGDLLTGFFVDDAPAFERWLDSRRNQLRAAAARAAYDAAIQVEKTGDCSAAASFARRSLDLAGTDERTLRKLIALQWKAGDRASAMETYDAFARALSSEYDTEPAAETRALMEQIRSEGERPGRVIAENAVAAKAEAGAGAQSSVPVRIGAEPTKRRSLRRERMVFIAAGIAVLISAGFAWNLIRPSASTQVLRYALDVDTAEPLAPELPFAARLAISPDGTRLAYTSGSRNGPPLLRIRSRDELHGVAVPGTEDAYTPFFSPDGQRVGFLREKSVWIATFDGAPPIHVSDSLTGIAGGSWGPDGYIYTDGFEIAPLARVKARQGAKPEWFTKLDSARGEIDHAWPYVLPNGKGVLFTVTVKDKDVANGSASFEIAVADIPSGKYRVIIQDGAYPVYTSSGNLLYVSSKQTLMMVPFDQSTMTVQGKPTPLLEGMRLGAFGATDLAVSATGTLIYAVGAGLSQYETELLWIARDGKRTPVDPDWHGMFGGPVISPDGKRLAVSKSTDGQSHDIWIKDLDRGPAIRLTHDHFANGDVTWTPDGQSVTFSANSKEGPWDLWTQRVDGTGEPVRQVPPRRDLFTSRWSPDGKWLLFSMHAKDKQGEVGGFRPGIDSDVVPLVSGKYTEVIPDVSPDGHWLVYQSDETGLYQIYVVPFPNTKGEKHAVTTTGGIHPRWSPRGNELFYRDTSGDINAIPVKTSPTFSSGKPQWLFSAKRREFPLAGHGIAPDGQRFLMVHLLHPNATDKIVVVENWFEELRANAVRK